MVKRKRVPLQLNGTDEQYFRTKEITGTHIAPPKAEPKAPTTEPVKATTQSKPKKKREPKQTAAVPEIETSEGEIISRIIHLGIPLTKRLHATADTFDVQIDDLLYAARKKAIKRLRRTLSDTRKPDLEAFDKGGETLRIAVSLSSTELEKLRTWFDPINIGISTKAVSPLITEAFRKEVEIICKANI